MLRKSAIAGLIMMMGLLIGNSTQAVWHPILTEHFDYTPQVWSTIANPGQYEPPPRWTVSPWHQWGQMGAPWTWGIESEIYQPGYGQYTRALWCVGLPGDLEPLQEPYPLNVDSWANYGPFNLGTAAAAKATFWYRYQTENSADYLAWGPAVGTTFYEVNRKFGPSTMWYSTIVNFDSIPNGSGGWISLLGQSTVYLKFHFHSDSLHLSNCMGGFIDELSISYDDGLYDLAVQHLGLAHSDSTITVQPLVGDSLRFFLIWSAAGTGVTPLFNISCQLDNQPFYIERRNVNFGTSQVVACTTYTSLWHVTDTNPHIVSWMLDANHEIPEVNETNNDTSMVLQAQGSGSPVAITLTPVNPPIVIPANGGGFSFDILVRNIFQEPVFCQAWIDATSPHGANYGPLWGPWNLTLPGEIILGRTRSQLVPETAPAGQYSYNAYVGNYPDSIWDSINFPFTKLASGNGPLVNNWLCTGDPFPGEEAVSLQPSAVGLCQAAPNPFNSSTVLSYELRVPSLVSLKVYDTAGSVVESLVNGWREAGDHHATFDGSRLATGLYFVRLQVEGQTTVQKVMLLK